MFVTVCAYACKQTKPWPKEKNKRYEQNWTWVNVNNFLIRNIRKEGGCTHGQLDLGISFDHHFGINKLCQQSEKCVTIVFAPFV